MTPEELRSHLYSHKHTLLQLRRKLLRVAAPQRAEALLGVFTDWTRAATAFRDQEAAGQLLLEVRPGCPWPLDQVLRSTAPVWDVSVEELPFYLEHVFGRDEVIAAATRLAAELPQDSPEARALATMRWWLKDKVSMPLSDAVPRDPSLLIEAALCEVEARMAEAFRNVPVPPEDHPLSQAGLRDGGDIVRDYLAHGEAGVAFEHLLYMIEEPPLVVSAECFAKIASAGRLLGFPEEAWAHVSALR